MDIFLGRKEEVRTEQEMMDIILKIAKEDVRVRAVGMNGSKTNPNVSQDPFQDYDIVYFVTELHSYLNDHNWILPFGEKIIMQMPDDSSLFPIEKEWKFAYLMQFTDGNGIDLTLWSVDYGAEWIAEDRLARIFLDKDALFQTLPPPTDQQYWVKKPNQKQFDDCCNEFWWVSTYVAKGLWRDEFLYAVDHLQLVREMLLKMMEWQVGIETNFSVSIGKNYKYLKKYLNAKEWEMLRNTYATARLEEAWSALFLLTELFENTTQKVAFYLNFQYEINESDKVKAYLKHVYQLPREAKQIY